MANQEAEIEVYRHLTAAWRWFQGLGYDTLASSINAVRYSLWYMLNERNRQLMTAEDEAAEAVDKGDE